MPWAKQLFDWKEGLVWAGGLVLLAVIAVMLFFAATWTLRGAAVVVLWPCANPECHEKPVRYCDECDCHVCVNCSAHFEAHECSAGETTQCDRCRLGAWDPQ